MKRLLAPLKRRLKLMITRGVVKLVDSNTLLQSLQVSALGLEVDDTLEHWEPYGFTSKPKPGAEALLFSLLGKRAHTVAATVADRRYRLRGLENGEVAINDDLGNVIHFKRDRILINSVDKVEVIAPACHIQAITTHDGNVTINGNLVVNGTANVTGMATVGGLAATGVAGAATVSGDLTVTGGDVTVDGISSKHHKHQENDSGGLTGEAQ